MQQVCVCAQWNWFLLREARTWLGESCKGFQTGLSNNSLDEFQMREVCKI